MYYELIKMSTANHQKLKKYEIGAVPLVITVIERLGIRRILSDYIHEHGNSKVSPVDTLILLIVNIILGRDPLYKLEQWVGKYDIQCFKIQKRSIKHLNDDRFGRELDKLYDTDRASMMTEIVVNMVKVIKLVLEQIHNDSTTAKAFGRIPGKTKNGLELKKGHSKEHRFDLKQILLSLSVAADGAVPIHYKVYPGNRTDDTVHRGNLEELREIVGRSDFVYVADGKLASAKNLQEIAAHGGKFVTILPRTHKEDEQFRKRLRARGIRWKEIHRIANKRRADDTHDVFYSCAGPAKTKDGYRLIWLRSSEKARRDGDTRLKQLGKARTELALLSKRLNRRELRSAPKIRKAVADILKRTQTKPFLQVRLTRRWVEEFKRCRPGRPAADDPVRVVRKAAWGLKLTLDRKALREELRVDGVFPLVTNLKASKKDVLLIYKYQPYVEKRFSQLKTELEVAPVYLKKPLRCAGLVHAYYVALAVAALIERAVRQGMKREGLKSLPLFPERRETKTPTCARILEAFEGVDWHEIRRKGEVQQFPVKLSKLQRDLLRLTGVPTELYR